MQSFHSFRLKFGPSALSGGCRQQIRVSQRAIRQPDAVFVGNWKRRGHGPRRGYRKQYLAAGAGEKSDVVVKLSDGGQPHDAPDSAALSASQNGVTNGTAPAPGPVADATEEDDRKAFVIRWQIVAMMAAAFVLCNMDKVNMSVAVIPMAAELGWSATERGLVSSSFFWGYSLTQLPAGWIATRIGGAKVLMAGVALWSFGTLLAPPAAMMSIYALCASRVLVGLGEGFAPSAATALLAKLVPATERARAVAAVWGGLDVGSAVGLVLCGPLIFRYGWPVVFYLFAILGVIWCFFWPLFKPQKRADQAVARARSVCDLTGDREACQVADSDGAVGALPWGAFFTSAPVWAIIVAHFCFNWGYYTLLAWLPSYFELALGLNVEKSSYLTLIPYIAMTCMTPLVGPIADSLVKGGMPLTRVRKLCQGAAFVGPAMCMVGCALLTPATPAAVTGFQVVVLVTLLSLGFAMGAWSRAGLYCNHQDLSPKYAGALLGITNTAGAFPGVLGVTAAGMLLDMAHSWPLALFYPTAACQIIGALVYTKFASSERQAWS